MESTADGVEAIINREIESRREALNTQISTELWLHPELGFEEKHAHDVLCDFLEKEKFVVKRNFHLPTAFRAEYGCSSGAKFTLCVMCEYDALPDIGHACGHNLIAEAGIAAAIAIKAIVNFDLTKGKLVVMGTPAEEGGGGKSMLIQAGGLQGIDVALMVHPGPYDVLDPVLLAVERMTIQYTGRAAHASLAPWEGVNALDAAVLCYTSIAFGRQHMRPNCRVHGVITKGGSKPNVVPSDTELIYYVRASNKKNLELLKSSVIHSVEGAASSTGCQVKYSWQPHGYESFVYVQPLQDLYKKYAEKYGIKYEDKYRNTFTGSTDMGNVSQIIPSIHPVFSIKTPASNHTRDFAEAAGAPEAQAPTLIAAKCMAFVAHELFMNEPLQNQIKVAFRNRN